MDTSSFVDSDVTFLCVENGFLSFEFANGFMFLDSSLIFNIQGKFMLVKRGNDI